MKDMPQYQNFTAFYNKINENYRTLIQQGLLKPVSIYKRKISQVGTSEGGRGRGRGGRGRGRGRDQGRGRGRGRGGHGRTGRGNPAVDLSCLPRDIDIQNLNSFTDEQWYGLFTAQQKQAIWALRRLHGNRGNNNYDDVSSLGQTSALTGTNSRQVYQLVQMPNVPPAQGSTTTPRPANQTPNQVSNEGSTRSANAGSAFGR